MLASLPPIDQTLLAFGRRLRAAREARGLSLDDLSGAAEISRLMLHLAEQGRERVDAAALHRISGVLHLPLHFLISTEGDPKALRPLR